MFFPDGFINKEHTDYWEPKYLRLHHEQAAAREEIQKEILRSTSAPYSCEHLLKVIKILSDKIERLEDEQTERLRHEEMDDLDRPW